MSSKNFKKGFFNELAKLAAQLADHHALPDVVHNFDDFSITKQRTASGYNAGLTFHARRPIIHVLDRTGRGNWFYQSQYGTGGKPKGLWYPVGGVVASGPNQHDDGWIIKGRVDTDPGYGRPDLARLGDAVNRRMPKDPGELSAFFKRLSGDKDRLTPEELINSPAFQKRVYAYTKDGGHPFDHSSWFLQDWKNRHLTPVWGSRQIQPTIAHTKLGFFDELEKLAAVFNGITFTGYDTGGKRSRRNLQRTLLADLRETHRPKAKNQSLSEFNRDTKQTIRDWSREILPTAGGFAFPGRKRAFINMNPDYEPVLKPMRRETIAHEAFHAAHPILGQSESLARLVGGWNAHKKSTFLQKIKNAAGSLGEYVLHKPTYEKYNPKTAKVLNALGFYKAFGRSDKEALRIQLTRAGIDPSILQ